MKYSTIQNLLPVIISISKRLKGEKNKIVSSHKNFSWGPAWNLHMCPKSKVDTCQPCLKRNLKREYFLAGCVAFPSGEKSEFLIVVKKGKKILVRKKIKNKYIGVHLCTFIAWVNSVLLKIEGVERMGLRREGRRCLVALQHSRFLCPTVRGHETLWMRAVI